MRKFKIIKLAQFEIVLSDLCHVHKKLLIDFFGLVSINLNSSTSKFSIYQRLHLKMFPRYILSPFSRHEHCFHVFKFKFVLVFLLNGMRSTKLRLSCRQLHSIGHSLEMGGECFLPFACLVSFTGCCCLQRDRLEKWLLLDQSKEVQDVTVQNWLGIFEARASTCVTCV